MNTFVTRDKIRAMFFLGAIGDALGMPVETYSRERILAEFGRMDRYHKPTNHKWFSGCEAGTWTDDTQLTLVVADSLSYCKEFDMADLASGHVDALEKAAFGWGGSTTKAVERYRGGMHWSQTGKTDNPKRGKGNGIAMKVAPLSVFLAIENFPWEGRFSILEQFASFTHATQMGIVSGVAQSAAVDYCLNAGTFDGEAFINHIGLISERAENIFPDSSEKDFLSCRLFNIAKEGSAAEMQDIQRHEVMGTGGCYVYESLPVALALMAAYPHSMDALYEAASYGKDTDSIAAMVGPLLGLVNGMDIVPEHLIDGLQQSEVILKAADCFSEAFGII